MAEQQIKKKNNPTQDNKICFIYKGDGKLETSISYSGTVETQKLSQSYF